MKKILIVLTMIITSCSLNVNVFDVPLVTDQNETSKNIVSEPLPLIEEPAAPINEQQPTIPTGLNCNIQPTTLGSLMNSVSGGGQSVFSLGNLSFIGLTSSSTPGLASQKGIQIVDSTNPSNLINLGYISTDSGPGKIDDSSNDVLDIFVEGNYLYAVTYAGGLLIIDISNPSRPVVTGKLNLDFETWAVVKKDNYVYIGNKTVGLQIVNVSNPFVPQLIGSYSIMSLTHIQIEGNKIYGSTTNGIKIIDISNQTSPILLGSINISDFSAYETYFSNNYLYAINKPNKTIKTYDVSDPSNIALINETTSETIDFRSIIGFQDKLYVAAGAGTSGRLYIYDISTKSSPTLTNSIDLSNRGMEIYINNGVVYTSNLDGKIQSIRVCQ